MAQHLAEFRSMDVETFLATVYGNSERLLWGALEQDSAA